MAFNYKIDVDKKFIWLEWNGTFDLQTIKSHTAAMYADSLYQPEFCGLCDARHADFQLDNDGISKVHEFIAEHPRRPSGPWAVICAEPMQTAYAMIYENMESPPHPTQVFCTEAAAIKWLKEFTAAAKN
jgi:hypothetical protein